MRQIILEKIVSTLQPLDFVLALWQGGSAAHGYTDEWSDIDIAVVVADNCVEETFEIVEKALTEISEIELKYRVPEPACTAFLHYQSRRFSSKTPNCKGYFCRNLTDCRKAASQLFKSTQLTGDKKINPPASAFISVHQRLK